MNKIIIALVVLCVAFYGKPVFAKDTVVVTPVDVEVCEQVPSENCEDVTNEECVTNPVETCEDVTTEVCETNPVTTCETVHHDGYWRWSVWHFVWVSSWNEEVCNTEDVTTCHDETNNVCNTEDVTTCENVTEEVCTPTEETVCHTETQSISSTHKTFTEDTRCHGLTPPQVTWAVYDPATSTLNWSAVGGDKVELKFGWVQPYQFKVTLTNDGHELVGIGTEIGYWTNHYAMRTVNGCKVGAWSYFN
jgi:hypothetical protein